MSSGHTAFLAVAHGTPFDDMLTRTPEKVNDDLFRLFTVHPSEI